MYGPWLWGSGPKAGPLWRLVKNTIILENRLVYLHIKGIYMLGCNVPQALFLNSEIQYAMKMDLFL